MKKITMALALLLLSVSTFAWTIGPMNYQGRLLDNAGVPVTGSYNFKVRIYDAASGGTLKFSEQQNSIAVNDGVYSFLVSTGTNSTGAWDIALWNTPQLFLEIEVNNETLSPRHLIAAAPYAFQANLALTTNNALALGGVSASQYQNTLADICVSSKGKWLELVGKCLGVGASFPGPTRVDWYTLTASNDFKNLDLSRADISGINFGGVDMTGSIFNATTYSVAGISGANFSNTQWNAAIATDISPYVLAANTKFSDATLKNMNMSKWDLSLAFSNADNFIRYSAAFLSACPAAISSVVFNNSVSQCKLMRAAGNSYFMLGFATNFSTTSAAAISSNGEVVLDLDPDVFTNAGIDSSSFVGVTVTQNFINTWLGNTDFRRAKLENITLDPAFFSNVKFANSEWNNVIYSSSSIYLVSDIDFTNAKLSHVNFNKRVANSIFTRAVLKDVYFIELLSTSFIGTILENVQINYIGGLPTSFDGTKIQGGFRIAYTDTANVPNMLFKDIAFSNATVSGMLTDINFTGATSFVNTVFRNLDLCSSTIQVPWSGFDQITWAGPAECPDGTEVTGSTTQYSGTCFYENRMTETAVANCTAGIPGLQ